ncbi:MAG TPA: nucleotidyl transferase AbiEii/AbiGii toxin family protein [Elusimicrobiota bacterium]|nr:nucleotidyl transferase AbiEii/AbiGii toxin family protein [Elusimicrobiota bacterium]
MISKSQIEELRDKWQTPEPNVAREYVQHVLLAALFGGIKEEVKLAFKGGTALRLLRQSSRFSEDLDFTGWSKAFHVGGWIKLAVREASTAGLDFKIQESNPTSGGWFALVQTKVHEWPVQIEWNISLRQTKNLKTETVLVASPLWTPYSVKSLALEEMVQEKVEALLRRKEPRDFYDVYFLLRERLGVRKIVAAKDSLIKNAAGLSAKAVEKELKQFLPRSQWALARQLPRLLLQELERL